MKKSVHQVLSLVMALCLVLSLAPAAFAEELPSATYAEVCTEEELKGALATATVTHICLGADIQLTDTLAVNRTVTLDLDEYSLSYIAKEYGAFPAIQVTGGSLTLLGDGAVYVEGRSRDGNVIGIQVKDGGSLYAEEMDVTVLNTGSGGGAYGISADCNATVSAADYTTIRARSANGTASAVYMPSGSLTGEWSDFYAVSGPDEAATAICANSVTLKSCTVIGQKKHDPTNYEAQNAIVSTGGTVSITNADEWSDSCIYGALSIPTESDIQGGYFYEDPKAFLKANYTTEPADGYIYVEIEDGTWQTLSGSWSHVIPAGKVARVGRTYYSNLKEAFENAGSSQEVELLSDCTLDSSITIPGGTSSMSTAKTLRLNLNGHYIIGNDTNAYLVVGDTNANMLALTIRDTATPQACTVPIKVEANSYLTIESGKFDVLPAYNGDNSDAAAKHIYITGGWYKDDPSGFVVKAASKVVYPPSDGYYEVQRNDKRVIVVIGDQVTSYDTATAAFAYLIEQDTNTDNIVKAIMSFNGPAALSGKVTLGKGLDLTMVYNYSYRNASCIKGDSEAKPTITVDGATITSGDTTYSTYALLLEDVDLVVNSGTITAKATNYARMGYVTAISAANGRVTINGGKVVADGSRGYPDRKCETKYSDYGSYSAAIFDNDAIGIDVNNGKITINSGADILAVGSSATGATVDGNNTSITMTGGAVKALAFSHDGVDNGSKYRMDDFQFAYGFRADYYDNMTVDVSGGTVYASGSRANGVSNAAGGNSMVKISGGKVTAEGSSEANGVDCHIARIIGGEISASCGTPNENWRSHYNAVGVMLTYPRNDSEGGPSVAGATISAEDTGFGEACGIFSKGVSEYDADNEYNPQKPELVVSSCTVSARAAKAFACAVNNDSGYKTTISGGSYSSVCTEGFADCICAYYTGDLDITDGSFSVQGVRGTSKYSGETYAATCIYNQSDGATTISGGSFLMRDGSGNTVESSAVQGTGLNEGEGTGLYRLLRVRNPADYRYDYAKDEYVLSGTPTLTVSGGLFSDMVSLTMPNVVADGYEVQSSGNTTYPWTVGKPAPIDPGYVGGGTTTYTPTITDSAHGKVTADPKAAAAGDTVKLTATPDAGYELDTLTVKDANGKDVALTKNTDGTYSYVQPAGKVTITATFKESKAEAERPFTDVKKTDWFYDAVYYCFDKGYYKGVSETLFDPQGTMTRAMFVTVLYRVAGEPAVTGENTFADVKAGQWYTDAILWASDAGVVNGRGEGFAPDAPVTREEIATMLYRFMQHMGLDVSGSASLAGFPDGGKTSPWAQEAMQWAVSAGLFQGDDSGALNPGGEATRAEVATLVERLAKLAVG